MFLKKLQDPARCFNWSSFSFFWILKCGKLFGNERVETLRSFDPKHPTGLDCAPKKCPAGLLKTSRDGVTEKMGLQRTSLTCTREACICQSRTFFPNFLAQKSIRVLCINRKAIKLRGRQMLKMPCFAANHFASPLAACQAPNS